MKKCILTILVLYFCAQTIFCEEKIEPLRNAQSIMEEEINAKNDLSYTGLTPEEEKKILLSIEPSKMDADSEDTLWQTISNAYIKSYHKLFREIDTP